MADTADGCLCIRLDLDHSVSEHHEDAGAEGEALREFGCAAKQCEVLVPEGLHGFHAISHLFPVGAIDPDTLDQVEAALADPLEPLVVALVRLTLPYIGEQEKRVRVKFKKKKKAAST